MLRFPRQAARTEAIGSRNDGRQAGGPTCRCFGSIGGVMRSCRRREGRRGSDAVTKARRRARLFGREEAGSAVDGRTKGGGRKIDG